jgi:hypothetical protein
VSPLPDRVFSPARLRGYRVIANEGLGDAVALQALNLLLASDLWLPCSLVEIAFRNATDRAIANVHPHGEGWLVTAGRRGDLVVARDVVGPGEFFGRREDGTFEDPVATAARMAGRQLGRDEISRDDVIAHLTFGFWVVRAPGGFGLRRVYDLVAASLAPPLHDGAALKHMMVNHVLRTRNRVAPLPCEARIHSRAKAGRSTRGRLRRKSERHRADMQQGDPKALAREGDPRGGLESEECRTADRRDLVEEDGVVMSGPGGAPQEGESG